MREECHRRDVGRPPAIGGRLWVVIFTKPPREDGPLNELRHILAGHGARGLTTDVYLVPDADGLETRLASFVDRIRAAGGHVLVADSRIVDPRFSTRSGT